MRATYRACKPVLETLEGRQLFSAGAIDPSFNAANTPGYIRDALGPNFGAGIGSIAIDPSTGDIIVAGGADGHLAVARYHSQGIPDTSFVGDGNITLPVTDHPGVIAAVIGGFDTATGVLVRPDGKIVVAGWVNNDDSNGADMFAMVLNSNGSLDTTFDPSNNGVAVIQAEGDQTAFDMVGSGNDVYVIGSGNDTLAIAKFTPTGPDNSFGSDGLLSVVIGDGLTITSGTLQSGGKMVVAGGDNAGGLIARVNLSTGLLDPTFGPNQNGTVVSPIHSSDFFDDITQDSQGRLLALGNYIVNGGEPFVEQAAEVQRFDANGNLDTAFGGANGAPAGEAEFLPADPQTPVAKTYLPSRMALDAQGRIDFTGTTRDATGNSEIDSVITARFTAAGARDPNYGTNGIALNTITGNFDAGQALAIQPDGKIVVGGSAAQTDFLTLRYAAGAAAPTVQQATYSYSTSPNAISFTFDEPITTGLAALQIHRTGDGLTITPTGFSYSAATHLANFTFNGPIPDGNYVATLPAASVTNSDGIAMSADEVFNFFSLAGDANHDGIVNVADLFAVAQNWLQSGKNFTQGDFNYDGVVNIDDLKILAINWNKTPSGASLAPQLGPMTTNLLPTAAPASAMTSITTTRRTKPMIQVVN